MNDIRYLIATLAVVLVLVSGCVWPGRIDPTTLNRYQQSLVDQGTRERGSDDLEPYIPNPAVIPPDLRVRTDPESGSAIIELNLDEAIRRALANSPEVRVVSYDPAIAREEMIQAAAEFDYVFTGSFLYNQQDNQTDYQFGGGMSDARTWEVGVRQKTITGADWSLKYTLTRTWDDQQFRTLPTRFEPRMVFQVTQPLLRDAWPRFNLARFRIARVNRRISEEAFRQRVEEILTEVTSNYWLLVQARRDVTIQEDLLQRTIETQNRIRERLRVDATQVELKQAESAVAIRRATLISARKIVKDVQYRLTRLLGDSQLNALSPFEIVPTTQPADALVELDLTDRLVTALHYNPILEQARLAIRVADINVRIAKNQTLPRLNLVGTVGVQGLDWPEEEADKEFWTGNFFSYSVGAQLEFPIGNREMRAQLRQKRYERLKSLAIMQNAADQVAVLIDERLRQVTTSFEEFKAQQIAVAAAKVQLSALEAREKMKETLSPSFLQTKLSAQETLAEAQRGEMRALTNYNIALLELDRATGTVLEENRVKLAFPVAMGEGDWDIGQTGESLPTR